MDEYDCYVGIIKSVLKHSKNEKYSTTSFSPQNLWNTIKKVAKINITQIIIIEIVCQNNRILLFFLISHKFYTFRLVDS